METASQLLAARNAYRTDDFARASALYEQALRQDGLDSVSVARFGNCKLRLGDAQGAADVLAGGLRSCPDDPALLTLHATALEFLGSEAEAAKLYRQVISSSPDNSAAYANLGYLMLTRGNFAGAEQCFHKSLEPSPTAVPSNAVLPTFQSSALEALRGRLADATLSGICVQLGLKLQELGRLEEARDCFTRAIELNELNAPAYTALAHSKKITQDDADLISRMSELIDRRDLTDGQRIRLGFALGKALDDLGDYEAAIRSFDHAHELSLKSGQIAGDRAGFEKDVDTIIATYSPECLADTSSRGSDSEAPVLIVGMMRSGTTLVEQILSSHPDVGGGEELLFWSDHGSRQLRSGSRPPNSEEAARLADAYLQVLRRIDPDAARVTDKMPHNFMAVGLIHRVFPNARIVCCRRNPVDTCLSIYMTDFRNAIPLVHSRADLAFLYREFDRIMRHWRSAVPADRLFEIQYEELLANREETTRKLIEFCGLEWDEACLYPERNTRVVKTASLWQVRQGVYANRERWRRYQPWLGELSALLP